MVGLAFLRSIEVGQALPHLSECHDWLIEQGLTSHLIYSDGDVPPRLFNGETTRLPDSGGLVDFVQAFERIVPPGGVGVSISIPDENVVRDAVLADSQAPRRRTILAPSVSAALTLSSKWETKHALTRHGITTPRGFYVDGDLLAGRASVQMEYPPALRALAQDLTFPVLAKPVWDCLGNGIVKLDDSECLNQWLNAGGMNVNCVIEELIDGELCSIEVISDGTTVLMQPVVWKGPTISPGSFAFEQVRWSHSSVHMDTIEPVLASRIRKMCRTDGLRGAFEFEFIATPKGFTCIEVNPRVSGSTAMSICASGVNTYIELCKIALSDWCPPDKPEPGGYTALQFPLASDEPNVQDFKGSTAEALRVSTFVVDGQLYPTALIRVSDDQLSVFLEWCRKDGSNLVSQDTCDRLEYAYERRAAYIDDGG
ncbi:MULTISPECIES: ATP-grasp domain-containing protein [unclassified Paenarthrobacter]|uniref:ATP-grasp domain-containing protein n=1 Tax=unclassified Paenarthrobacter TaxID=2634190 RepID=UPI003CF87404